MSKRYFGNALISFIFAFAFARVEAYETVKVKGPYKERIFKDGDDGLRQIEIKISQNRKLSVLECERKKITDTMDCEVISGPQDADFFQSNYTACLENVGEKNQFGALASLLVGSETAFAGTLGVGMVTSPGLAIGAAIGTACTLKLITRGWFVSPFKAIMDLHKSNKEGLESLRAAATMKRVFGSDSSGQKKNAKERCSVYQVSKSDYPGFKADLHMALSGCRSLGGRAYRPIIHTQLPSSSEEGKNH